MFSFLNKYWFFELGPLTSIFQTLSLESPRWRMDVDVPWYPTQTDSAPLAPRCPQRDPTPRSQISCKRINFKLHWICPVVCVFSKLLHSPRQTARRWHPGAPPNYDPIHKFPKPKKTLQEHRVTPCVLRLLMCVMALLSWSLFLGSESLRAGASILFYYIIHYYIICYYITLYYISLYSIILHYILWSCLRRVTREPLSNTLSTRSREEAR